MGFKIVFRGILKKVWWYFNFGCVYKGIRIPPRRLRHSDIGRLEQKWLNWYNYTSKKQDVKIIIDFFKTRSIIKISKGALGLFYLPLRS